MQWRLPATALLLGTIVLVGCKKEEATPPTRVEPRSGPAANAMKQARDIAGQAKTDTSNTVDAVKNSDAAKAVTDASNATATKANELIEQAMTYAKDNKWDLADSTLSQVEKMEGSLPDSLKPKIAEARKMIDAHKAAAAAATAVPATPTTPAAPAVPAVPETPAAPAPAAP